jgi:NifU-like protein involved in Fe-S cluster formation
MEELYTRSLLERAANIGHLGHLPHVDAKASCQAKLCGSTLSVELAITDGVVTGFAQQVSACALGQAAASIIAEKIIGRPLAELKALSQIMQDMLKNNGPPPSSPWRDLALFLPIRDFPARHASTLLVFTAVAQAIESYETEKRSY